MKRYVISIASTAIAVVLAVACASSNGRSGFGDNAGSNGSFPEAGAFEGGEGGSGTRSPGAPSSVSGCS